MKLKKLLIGAFTGIALGVLAMAWVVFEINDNQKDLVQAHLVRFQSYLLAEELRQSSDDLTRLARTLVITGDQKYEKMYWDILDIRNGKKPRPEHYERIYWDLMLEYGKKPKPDGEAKPLQQRMLDLGFSDEELALLKEAQDNSDGLVHTETVAMNAVKELFEKESGGGNPDRNYTERGEPVWEMARRIMHDADYHIEKARIMEPIDRFLEKLDQRTLTETEHFTQKGDDLLKLAKTVVIGMLLMAVGIGFFVVHRTWRILGCEPVYFSEMASRVAKGDLAFAMEDICPQLRKGEERNKGLLAQAISTMLNALKKQTLEINSTLARAVGDLSTTATELASSATETSSTISHVGNTVEEVRHIAHKANDTTKAVMEEAQRMRDVSRQGSLASREAEASMQTINDEMKGIADTIVRLSEQTQSIGEINQAVTDIADQSNLLSINASIEASKAGEYGKGFSVVAQEMKNLTEQSKAATGKIGAILGEVQQATGRAVLAAERGGKAVTLGMDLAAKAGASIAELSHNVEDSTTAVEQIGASSLQQLSGMDQLVDAIDNIKTATNQNVDGARQLEQAAKDLRGLVKELGEKTQNVTPD